MACSYIRRIQSSAPMSRSAGGKATGPEDGFQTLIFKDEWQTALFKDPVRTTQ